VTVEQLRAQVGWTVEDPPPGRSIGRVAGGLLRVVSAVATFGADIGTGARRATWELPADPDGYLDLGPVALRMPGSAREEQVRAGRRGVWATSSSADRPPRLLPVQDWRVVAAAPGTGSGRPREPEARWTLTVTDGTTTGTLTGAWLALAWIGHVAGWPEPAAS